VQSLYTGEAATSRPYVLSSADRPSPQLVVSKVKAGRDQVRFTCNRPGRPRCPPERAGDTPYSAAAPLPLAAATCGRTYGHDVCGRTHGTGVLVLKPFQSPSPLSTALDPRRRGASQRIVRGHAHQHSSCPCLSSTLARSSRRRCCRIVGDLHSDLGYAEKARCSCISGHSSELHNSFQNRPLVSNK